MEYHILYWMAGAPGANPEEISATLNQYARDDWRVVSLYFNPQARHGTAMKTLLRSHLSMWPYWSVRGGNNVP